MKYFFTLIISLSNFKSYNQSLTPVLKAVLPAVINESSGLEVNSRNKVWSHNDSGGNPELYEFDSTGVLTRTLQITNATNVDWEDLAQDSIGTYYIGDFGNNNNDRQDLKIYIIPNPDSITGNSVTAQVINFSYPDQAAFPPPDAQKNFDMEGFVAMNNSLYLFSKNRTVPFNGYTKLYKLPDTAGTYVAQLLDSFYAGPGPFPLSVITAADISPDHLHLLLLGYTKCWMFSNFTGEAFFSGTVQSFMLNGTVTQKEGACFINNTELYLSDEHSGSTGGNLYYLNLQPVINKVNEHDGDKIKLNLAPDPFSDHLGILFGDYIPTPFKVSIFNMTGENVFTQNIFRKDENKIELPLGFLNTGVYELQIVADEKNIVRKKIVKM